MIRRIFAVVFAAALALGLVTPVLATTDGGVMPPNRHCWDAQGLQVHDESCVGLYSLAKDFQISVYNEGDKYVSTVCTSGCLTDKPIVSTRFKPVEFTSLPTLADLRASFGKIGTIKLLWQQAGGSEVIVVKPATTTTPLPVKPDKIIVLPTPIAASAPMNGVGDLWGSGGQANDDSGVIIPPVATKPSAVKTVVVTATPSGASTTSRAERQTPAVGLDLSKIPWWTWLILSLVSVLIALIVKNPGFLNQLAVKNRQGEDQTMPSKAVLSIAGPKPSKAEFLSMSPDQLYSAIAMELRTSRSAALRSGFVSQGLTVEDCLNRLSVCVSSFKPIVPELREKIARAFYPELAEVDNVQ